MESSDTRYVYNCDVKTSSVTYETDAATETSKMWDDEPPAWGDDDATAATGEGGAVGADGEPLPDFEAPPPILPADREKVPAPKYTLHWVRPLFLNYDYIYDYRKNYYDDVIDYLDSRQRGINRETPRAQEWAERTLRTYVARNTQKSGKRSADIRQMTALKPIPRHYSYHTRAYYSLKYQKIL